MLPIIMVRVKPSMTILAGILLAATAYGQVPPGESYNPKKHPNPIITYIETKEFRKTTYKEAKTATGFDPLGLSERQGSQQSIELALPKPAIQRIALPDDEFSFIRTEFYPVVRQTYVLKSGELLVLDAFQFPKVPIPLNDLTGVLNTAAFWPGDKYLKPRFGPATVPERVTVRGLAALLFDDNKEYVLFWREGTECYVIKTKTTRTELFRLVADLL